MAETVLVISCWLVLVVQLFILVRYLVVLWRRQTQNTPVIPPVSIIVCAHDEEANIKQLVPDLLRQDYPEFEVIIVEDRCNDNTYDYLLEATRQDSRLKMVRVQFLPEHITGKKYALTLGVKAAIHDWVLLTDADCRPTGNAWLSNMAAHMTPDKQIVVGYSPYRKDSGYLNTFIRFESLLTGIQFMGSALLQRPYMGTGRNLAYRKKLFLDNKGFHDHLSVMGGDDDLFVNRHSTRTNTAVSMGPESLVYSIPKTSWAAFLHQKLRHLSVGKHYRWRDRWRLGLFMVTWVLTWIVVLPVMIQPEAMEFYLWAGFLLRELMLITLIHRASRTLGDPFESWKTPLLDINFAIYYLGTGLVALVSKQSRWKI